MANLTEEQNMLRDAARGWATSNSPIAAFRKIRDDGVEAGFDAGAWKEMTELGWASVLVDLADLFMYDLAGIGVNPDRTRSTWFKVKAFKETIRIRRILYSNAINR